MTETVHIILNGELVEKQEAKISPLNRGVMYGDGCFETIRYYSGSFLGWDRHYQRLKNGLDYVGIQPAFSADELMKQIRRLLKVNQLAETEAMIRIQCWREGGRGYMTKSKKMGWTIQAGKMVSDASPLKLNLAKTRCIPSEALRREYKLSNGLNYIKAAQEASQSQCDDSLMLTVGDMISETTSSNIFWVKGGIIYTPSVKCDLLPGITREVIIEVIKDLGIQIVEGEFSLDEIKKAEAAFCTNSLIEIKEVGTFDGLSFERDIPLIRKLKTGFEQYKVQEWSK